MTTGKLIAIALLGAVAYWLFDSATDAFIFQEGMFRSLAFSPSPHEIYMRSIIIALLAAMGSVAVLIFRHKKAEDVLRQKDELLRMTSEMAKVGGWEFDVATMKGTWTDEIARIHELPPEQETNVELGLSFYTPESRIMISRGIQEAIGSARPYDLELEMVTAQGAHKWVRTVGFPIMEGDKVAKVKGTFQDITDRKHAEQALRESDVRFRSLFDSMLNGFAYCRMLFENGVPVDFVYLEVNGAFERLTGLKNVVGRKVTDVIPGIREANPELFEMYGRTVSTGEPAQREQYVAPLDMWFSISVYRPQEGCFVAVFDVITERKKSEQALRESEERISLILNSTEEGIYGFDQAGSCTFCNAAGVGMLGYRSEQDLLGKNIHDLMHHTRANGTPYPKDLSLAIKVLSNGEYVHSDKEVLWRADGSGFLAEYWAHPIQRDGKTIGAVVTFIDITEHRKLEDQYRQAQKMEAIGQLAGGVAHDFNNILSAIIGYGHLSLMKLPENDPIRHYIEQILQSSERATALTQSLLTFSRKQLVKKEPVKLNSVICNFEKFLVRLLREDIEMKMRYSEEELTIVADRGQIEQVIMNLVTNARDAMPAKGRLTMETRLEVLDETFVSAHGYGRPGEYAMISVSDTGIGMDEVTQRKIFEPFFTTKEQGKGTGLGLATVYGIVKTHEGFINVYSEPGKGTVFHIYLPLVRSAEEVREPVAQAPVPLKGGTETILLAEDDESLRKMTAIVLRHVGYTVLEVENGQDAVKRFIENKDIIRLVILDGIMPVMNGKEAYREISALCPDMRCIFMSGYAEDVFTKDGILQADVEFISKPVTPSALLHTVREVLDR